MEAYNKSPATYVNSRIVKNIKQEIMMEDILLEYNIKRDIFYPRPLPPNIFIHNLERRMMNYYNSLYSSPNRETI